VAELAKDKPGRRKMLKSIRIDMKIVCVVGTRSCGSFAQRYRVDQPRTQIKRKGNSGDDLHRTAGPGLLRAVGGGQRASSAAALPSGERSPSTRRVSSPI
jgi:hypothetical protein